MQRQVDFCEFEANFIYIVSQGYIERPWKERRKEGKEDSSCDNVKVSSLDCWTKGL